MSESDPGPPRRIGWAPATTGPAVEEITDPLPPWPGVGAGVDRSPRRRGVPAVLTAMLLMLLAVALAAGSIALVAGGVTIPSLPGSEPTAPPPRPYGTTLPGVFTYQQQRSLSCEYASLSIATTMVGRPVSEFDIGRLVPLAKNPHEGYRGDIDGEWGNTDDYGVYNEPLAEALPRFGLQGTVIYGGRDDLVRELDLGRPTVVWLAMRGAEGSFDAWTDDGTRFQLTQWMHVMLAYGYDEAFVYLTDPGTAVLRQYDWATFLAMWQVMDGMALSVHA